MLIPDKNLTAASKALKELQDACPHDIGWEEQSAVLNGREYAAKRCKKCGLIRITIGEEATSPFDPDAPETKIVEAALKRLGSPD